MFRFAHTEYLYLLYIIPIIILFIWYVYIQQKKLMNKFADSRIVKLLAPFRSSSKYFVKSGIIVFALVMLILALANPQIGTKYQEVKQTGIDVFILLDVSNSMRAEDIKPNRLEKAKYSIASLIQKLKGDRIGLVIFSGDAYVQFPLTTDYAAANLLLNSVSFSSVPTQGTAIAPAINLATASFKADAPTQKVIIVITDGEDHEGDLDDAINSAKEKKIKVYTIGLGSPTGVPIPVYNSSGNQSGYKEDNSGNVVLTKLDETILQQIASDGEGRYFRGGSGNELDMIYKELSRFEETEFGTTRITDYEDRFYFLLIPALLLLILEFIIPEKKSRLLTAISKKLGINS